MCRVSSLWQHRVMLCVSKMWVCRSELYGSFGTCRQPQPSSRLAHRIPLFYVCFVCLGRPWDPTDVAWRTPAQDDRTPPPADPTLARRTPAPACLGSWRASGQPADAPRFPVGLVLCYTWYCGTPADRRGVCGGATIAAATRRHGATVDLLGIQVSAREIWTANIAWELHRSHFRKDILAYIYCWLRPFASISLVRIGTSLVG